MQGASALHGHPSYTSRPRLQARLHQNFGTAVHDLLVPRRSRECLLSAATSLRCESVNIARDVSIEAHRSPDKVRLQPGRFRRARGRQAG